MRAQRLGGRKAPFGAGVGDAKAVALGIALRTAARLSDHHREVASGAEGIARALAKESGLQPTTAELGERGSAAKQSHAFANMEQTRRAGLTVEFGEEAYALLLRGRDSPYFQKKVQDFRVVVRPAFGIDFTPESTFIAADWTRADSLGI